MGKKISSKLPHLKTLIIVKKEKPVLMIDAIDFFREFQLGEWCTICWLKMSPDLT